MIMIANNYQVRLRPTCPSSTICKKNVQICIKYLNKLTGELEIFGGIRKYRTSEVRLLVLVLDYIHMVRDKFKLTTFEHCTEVSPVFFQIRPPPNTVAQEYEKDGLTKADA